MTYLTNMTLIAKCLGMTVVALAGLFTCIILVKVIIEVVKKDE